MTKRQDLEADVVAGGQEWNEPDNMDMTPGRIGGVFVLRTTKDMRDAFAPVTTPNPDIERAMRQITEADIHGAFGGNSHD